MNPNFYKVIYISPLIQTYIFTSLQTSPTQVRDDNGVTPLRRACDKNDLDCVRLFFEMVTPVEKHVSDDFSRRLVSSQGGEMKWGKDMEGGGGGGGGSFSSYIEEAVFLIIDIVKRFWNLWIFFLSWYSKLV